MVYVTINPWLCLCPHFRSDHWIRTSPYRVHRHPQSTSQPQVARVLRRAPVRRPAAYPFPRQERSGSSTLRPSTSSQQISSGFSMEDTDAVALKNARTGVWQFVKAHPHVLEPCVGDSVAKTIIGSTPRLWTPGRSLCSVFFGLVIVANPVSLATSVHT